MLSFDNILLLDTMYNNFLVSPVTLPKYMLVYTNLLWLWRSVILKSYALLLDEFVRSSVQICSNYSWKYGNLNVGGYLVKESDKNIGLYETLFYTVSVKTRNKYSFYLKLRLAKMSCSFVRCVLKYLTFEKWLIIIRMFPYSIN